MNTLHDITVALLIALSAAGFLNGMTAPEQTERAMPWEDSALGDPHQTNPEGT